MGKPKIYLSHLNAYLLEQGVGALQNSSRDEIPEQFEPLKAGFGLLQNRLLSLIPPPQVVLQALQEDQEPHIPSTAKDNINE